jgi:hypothetical protein
LEPFGYAETDREERGEAERPGDVWRYGVVAG